MTLAAGIGALLVTSPLLAQTTQPSQATLRMLLGFGGKNIKSQNSDPIIGMYDLNRDGRVDAGTPGELFQMLRKSFSNNNGNGAFMNDERWAIEAGDISFYYTDGGDGYILRARDSNANGRFEDGEVTVWNQFGTSRTFGPNSLAIDTSSKNTVIYTALNESSSRPVGIYRSVDANNNGKANDSGETVMLLNKASKLTVPGKSGTVTLSQDHWERVRYVQRNKTLIAFNSSNRKRAVAPVPADNFCYYAFKETNGKLTNTAVFFNPSKRNGIPENADIKSGAMVDLDVQDPAAKTKFYNGFRFLEIDPDGYRRAFPVYYFATESGPGRTNGGNNAGGKKVHGIVLRGIDLNNDGDLQDKGEVTIFFNGSGNDLAGGNGTVKAPTWKDSQRGNTNDIKSFITGLAEINGVIYVMHENGGPEQILELRDKNNNGVIETGEVQDYYTTVQPYAKVFHPSFGPFSQGLGGIDRDLVVDPLPTGVAPFGKGCAVQSGLLPRISTTGGGPVVNNSKFRVELKRANAQVASFLWLGSSNKFLVGSIPLPFALGVLGMTNCNQHVSIDALFATVNNRYGGAGLPLGIPNDSKLKGAKIYLQWWTQDSKANRSGIVVSNAAEVTIQ